jgi:hypothetical protein
MGMPELKELVKPLSQAERKMLRQILDESSEDHAIFHLGELAAEVIGDSPPPPDFAEKFREHTRTQKIAHE